MSGIHIILTTLSITKFNILLPIRPLLSERVSSPKPPSFYNSTDPTRNVFNDEPLNAARRRAERVITEDAFFDVRGARVPKSSVGETIKEFDEEVGYIYSLIAFMNEIGAPLACLKVMFFE